MCWLFPFVGFLSGFLGIILNRFLNINCMEFVFFFSTLSFTLHLILNVGAAVAVVDWLIPLSKNKNVNQMPSKILVISTSCKKRLYVIVWMLLNVTRFKTTKLLPYLRGRKGVENVWLSMRFNQLLHKFTACKIFTRNKSVL